MFPAHIEKALSDVDLRFNEVSAALVSGDPQTLSAASTGLRQAAMDISALVKQMRPSDLNHEELKLRLKTLTDGLAVRRESLIRRTVLVERALNAVVPSTERTTYANVASPYGSAGKQTGTFKIVSA